MRKCFFVTAGGDRKEEQSSFCIRYRPTFHIDRIKFMLKFHNAQ